jgi:hypothetical protein
LAGRRLGFRVSGWWRWSRPVVVMAAATTVVELGLGFGFRGAPVFTRKGRGFGGRRRTGGGAVSRVR